MFIPGLAQITEPFNDILKKQGTWEWKQKHDLAFNQAQNSVHEIKNCYILIDQTNCP